MNMMKAIDDMPGSESLARAEQAGPAAAPAQDAAAAPAFFSARDMHAYYGESYIVQGVGFDVRKIRIHTQVGSGSCVDPVAEIQSAIRLEVVDSVCAVVYVSSGDERQDVQAQTLL